MTADIYSIEDARRKREERTEADLLKIANDPRTNPVSARAIKSLLEVARILRAALK